MLGARLTMDEYRIEIKVKNNLIMEKINELGFTTVAAFCKTYNIGQSKLGDVINMTCSPLKEDGDFIKIIQDISDIFCCCPEDLFSENQMRKIWESNKFVRKVSEAEAKLFCAQNINQKSLEEIIHGEELGKRMNDALETLTPREAKVIKERHGIDCDKLTLSESAEKHGVTRERIRQIESKALRKLRHPSRGSIIKEFFDN